MRKAAERLYRSELKPVSRRRGLHMAIVEGFSMWPDIKPGHKIYYQKTLEHDLSAGDIVVLKGRGRNHEPRLIVHRLLGRVGPYFLEAGDNSFVASLVAPNEIQGRVEFAEDNRRKRYTPKAVPLDQLRFQFFELLAHAFMFTHEMKDRLVGKRKSLILWKLSQAYRGSLRVAGLSVPPIMPR